ncbi:MAG: hypothetical protein ACTSR8_06795 [Promethearchaeota archaeon]
MTEKDWKEKIRFISFKENKIEKAIRKINKALEDDKEFLEAEYLTGILKDYTEEFNITIYNKKTRYDIDLGPKSGEGHDFQFSINKVTGRLDKDSLAVGEVIPPPDF